MDERSSFFSSGDGLRLHARTWTPLHESGRVPAVCLPGLTRSWNDFKPLATALATGVRARRVVALDYRGRGLSDHDPECRYDLSTERGDILRILSQLAIDHAHFVGTSRGGLHVMAMAAEHRPLIAGVVLNDIGPVLEAAGLGRIKGYIGRSVEPRSLAEAVRLMKLGEAAAGFTGLDDAGWRHFAETTFGSGEAGDQGDLRLRYDPALAHVLDAFDLSQALPDLWDQFDALRGAPILTIRGAASDLLSETTLSAMERRWPGNRSHVVPGQAHAPLLADADTIAVIAAYFAEVDEHAS